MTKNTSIYFHACKELMNFMFPVLSFGPKVLKNSLFSNMVRKAFSIEYKED